MDGVTAVIVSQAVVSSPTELHRQLPSISLLPMCKRFSHRSGNGRLSGAGQAPHQTQVASLIKNSDMIIAIFLEMNRYSWLNHEYGHPFLCLQARRVRITVGLEPRSAHEHGREHRLLMPRKNLRKWGSRKRKSVV